MRFQVLEQRLVRDHGFGNAILERTEILVILTQCEAYGIVDDVRHRPIRMRGFQADGLVQLGPKIDGGAFRGLFAHDASPESL
jgi:hypothetical protein